MCPTCYLGSRACVDIPLSVHQECLADPGSSQCNFECTDFPSAQTNRLLMDGGIHSNSSTMMWPRLDQGEWVEDVDNCTSVQNTTQACLFDKFRWSVRSETSQDFHSFSRNEACDLLHERNITQIRMVGDSLVRNMWQGMVLTLTGDAQHQFPSRKNCVGGGAFYNPACRGTRKGVPSMNVCQRRTHNTDTGDNDEKEVSIVLSFRQSIPYEKGDNLNVEEEDANGNGKTWVVYGIGNHPLNGGQKPSGRLKIYNAQVYRDFKFDPSLSKMTNKNDTILFWVPPHHRYRIGRHDESNERSRKFLHKTSQYFGSRGIVSVNTYALTYLAGHHFCLGTDNTTIKGFPYRQRETCQDTRETWDGVHFGPVVNQWKAHMLLHRLRMYSWIA